jgi:hypothetical protein
MAKRRGIVAEFADFVWQKKLFWMLPIIIVLLLLAALVVLGSTSAAPFVYTLF